jgi:hypothetical protein
LAKEVSMTEDSRLVPSEFRGRLKHWKCTAISFAIVHYLCGVGGVVSSCVAASALTWAKYAAIVSAVCFGILGFVQPMKIYYQFMSAYRVLKDAVVRYRYEESDISCIVNAALRAEMLIQSMDEQIFFAKDKAAQQSIRDNFGKPPENSTENDKE